MRRVFKNDEERREAKRIQCAKWREKNRERERQRQRDYYLNNRNSEIERRMRYHNDNKHKIEGVFYVYTHTNSKNQLYIGSGRGDRPYKKQNSSRSKYWIEAFKDDCTVKIIREFKTREEARFLESNMIRAIGLDNLINVRA